MSEKQVVRIEVEGASTLPISEFTELQGDLKTLLKEDYERFRKEIIDEGFSFVVHIWINPEDHKSYILDGHQRIRTLKQMMKDGWEVPPLPIAIVQAKSFRDAKRKLLSATSQYGRMKEEGLAEYIQDMEMTPEELSSKYRFADLDMHKFIESHFQVTPENELEDYTPEVAEPNEMRHASVGVRMVQLFFDNTTHPEFAEKVGALAPKYGKENVTDTLMEIVRESYQAHFPNA